MVRPAQRGHEPVRGIGVFRDHGQLDGRPLPGRHELLVLASAAAYPATPHIRLATVVAGATSITSIADNRKCFVACGAWADGMNITLGTATGTQIGTAATQKLGFFGHTPAVQPTMGAATAGTSYTANEQAMLNAVYSAVRAGTGELIHAGLLRPGRLHARPEPPRDVGRGLSLRSGCGATLIAPA